MSRRLDRRRRRLLYATGAGAICFVAYKLWETYREQERRLENALAVARRQKNSSPKNKPKGVLSHDLPLPVREPGAREPFHVEALKAKMTLEDIDFGGKRILIRVDYNVQSFDGRLDFSRVLGTVATLKHILSSKQQCKCIVLIAHLARPGSQYNREDLSLKKCMPVLKKELDCCAAAVKFLDDCIGEKVEAAIGGCEPGTVFLCENLRFYVAETGYGIDSEGRKLMASGIEKKAFATGLSRLGDLFVFEAFATAHRPHTSVVGIDLPIRVPGLIMQKEMDLYGEIFSRHKVKRPFVAVVGGARLSDKIGVIEHLLEHVDELILAGGQALTFKKVLHGINIGASVFDREGAKHVGRLMRMASEQGVKVHLPMDHVVADSFRATATLGMSSDPEHISEGWMALDIGPKTQLMIASVFQRAGTVLWSGPLGVLEMPTFASGTHNCMAALCEATAKGTKSVMAGGGTATEAGRFYVGGATVASQLSHVSTGGSSSLVLMEGKLPPAIVALSNHPEARPLGSHTTRSPAIPPQHRLGSRSKTQYNGRNAAT